MHRKCGLFQWGRLRSFAFDMWALGRERSRAAPGRARGRARARPRARAPRVEGGGTSEDGGGGWWACARERGEGRRGKSDGAGERGDVGAA